MDDEAARLLARLERLLDLDDAAVSVEASSAEAEPEAAEDTTPSSAEAESSPVEGECGSSVEELLALDALLRAGSVVLDRDGRCRPSEHGPAPTSSAPDRAG